MMWHQHKCDDGSRGEVNSTHSRKNIEKVLFYFFLFYFLLLAFEKKNSK
jgi:hypothetical protein